MHQTIYFTGVPELLLFLWNVLLRDENSEGPYVVDLGKVSWDGGNGSHKIQFTRSTCWISLAFDSSSDFPIWPPWRFVVTNIFKVSLICVKKKTLQISMTLTMGRMARSPRILRVWRQVAEEWVLLVLRLRQARAHSLDAHQRSHILLVLLVLELLVLLFRLLSVLCVALPWLGWCGVVL